MARGERLKGALRREPRQQLTRVSPGVYRNQSGRIVNQQGRSMGRRGGDGRDRASMVAGETGQMFGGYGGRTLSPEERQQRGINPNDPNQYWFTPDGKVVGTLMGWSDNPDQARAMFDKMRNNQNPMQWRPSPMQPQLGPNPQMYGPFVQAANTIAPQMTANPQSAFGGQLYNPNKMR